MSETAPRAFWELREKYGTPLDIALHYLDEQEGRPNPMTAEEFEFCHHAMCMELVSVAAHYRAGKALERAADDLRAAAKAMRSSE